MSYNEQEFYRLVKKANFTFKEQGSSLAPVITAMHLPRNQQVLSMRNAIAAMPAAKKLRYQEALRYLEREYAGDWLGVPQPPAPPGLRKEYKIGWKATKLIAETVLVHCTGAPPTSVMVNGIDPAFSTEWCIPNEANAPLWTWNRFAFLFMLEEDNFPPKKAEQFGFGAGGYVYVVKVPAFTTFMNQNGALGPNKESAFPEVIKPEHIIGLFQYTTGDQEVPARRKLDYTLTQLRLTSPYDVIATHQGVNSNVPGSVLAGTMAKQVLGL